MVVVPVILTIVPFGGVSITFLPSDVNSTATYKTPEVNDIASLWSRETTSNLLKVRKLKLRYYSVVAVRLCTWLTFLPVFMEAFGRS